jgi:hypothetical protein
MPRSESTASCCGFRPTAMMARTAPVRPLITDTLPSPVAEILLT